MNNSKEILKQNPPQLRLIKYPAPAGEGASEDPMKKTMSKKAKEKTTKPLRKALKTTPLLL